MKQTPENTPTVPEETSFLTPEDLKIISERKAKFLSGEEQALDAYEAGKELLKLFEK
ncbi:MAG: hypothetical protein IM638_05800 [Bacteroidetes bacterium]|nr:hypothetical protein [Bacteroidota bacterium]